MMFLTLKGTKEASNIWHFPQMGYKMVLATLKCKWKEVLIGFQKC